MNPPSFSIHHVELHIDALCAWRDRYREVYSSGTQRPQLGTEIWWAEDHTGQERCLKEFMAADLEDFGRKIPDPAWGLGGKPRGSQRGLAPRRAAIYDQIHHGSLKQEIARFGPNANPEFRSLFCVSAFELESLITQFARYYGCTQLVQADHWGPIRLESRKKAFPLIEMERLSPLTLPHPHDALSILDRVLAMMSAVVQLHSMQIPLRCYPPELVPDLDLPASWNFARPFHYDLSPDQFLLRAGNAQTTDQVVLIDFGAARIDQTDFSEFAWRSIPGKDYYQPPERRAHPLGQTLALSYRSHPAYDLYALLVIALFLFARQDPHQEKIQQIDSWNDTTGFYAFLFQDDLASALQAFFPSRKYIDPTPLMALMRAVFQKKPEQRTESLLALPDLRWPHEQDWMLLPRAMDLLAKQSMGRRFQIQWKQNPISLPQHHAPFPLHAHLDPQQTRWTPGKWENGRINHPLYSLDQIFFFQDGALGPVLFNGHIHPQTPGKHTIYASFGGCVDFLNPLIVEIQPTPQPLAQPAQQPPAQQPQLSPQPPAQPAPQPQLSTQPPTPQPYLSHHPATSATSAASATSATIPSPHDTILDDPAVLQAVWEDITRSKSLSPQATHPLEQTDPYAASAQTAPHYTPAPSMPSSFHTTQPPYTRYSTSSQAEPSDIFSAPKDLSGSAIFPASKDLDDSGIFESPYPRNAPASVPYNTPASTPYNTPASAPYHPQSPAGTRIHHREAAQSAPPPSAPVGRPHPNDAAQIPHKAQNDGTGFYDREAALASQGSSPHALASPPPSSAHSARPAFAASPLPTPRAWQAPSSVSPEMLSDPPWVADLKAPAAKLRPPDANAPVYPPSAHTDFGSDRYVRADAAIDQLAERSASSRPDISDPTASWLQEIQRCDDPAKLLRDEENAQRMANEELTTLLLINILSRHCQLLCDRHQLRARSQELHRLALLRERTMPTPHIEGLWLNNLAMLCCRLALYERIWPLWDGLLGIDPIKALAAWLKQHQNTTPPEASPRFWEIRDCVRDTLETGLRIRQSLRKRT